MPMPLPAGPYRTLTTPEGAAFPYYIIPFDADGVCTGPLTRDHLLGHLDGVTDIFVFSHGWNNDWTAATTRYEGFIKGVQDLRASMALPVPADYRPLLVGIYWPSQALRLFESETGPGFAALDPVEQHDEMTAMQAALQDIAARLPAADRERFHRLANAEALADGEDRDLATLLATALGTSEDAEAGLDAPPDADDLLASAAAIATPEPDYDAVGSIDTALTGVMPMAAGVFGSVARVLDPRNLLKPFTVWQMKDRAGTVGGLGVAPLLEALLTRSASTTRVHLLGHSYGCKVMMTAACRMAPPTRPIESALLLQPAISQYAFSESVPRRNVPGGFASALTRIRQPVMATFSEHDDPLHRMFHLSVRRHDDVGELQYAADGTPSEYAALGGYGPQATAVASIMGIRNPGAAYALPPAPAIIGLDGSRAIKGHGDILNPSVWWAAWTLATAHLAQGGAGTDG